MKKIILSLILLTSLSIADTFEIKPYTTEKNNINEYDNTFAPGVAIDAYPKEFNGFGFKVAYEGDFMILNDYMPDENKIEENNYYFGVGYKF